MREESAVREADLEASDEVSQTLATNVGGRANLPSGIRYATDEEVRLASEKVFRLHSRLLAKLAE